MPQFATGYELSGHGFDTDTLIPTSYFDREEPANKETIVEKLARFFADETSDIG